MDALRLNRETRVIAASPRTRLARLPEAERQLLLLLVSLGATEARERLELLSPERRDQLAPLAAEIMSLPPEERRQLFSLGNSPKPSTHQLNARLKAERPRLATLLLRELAPSKVPAKILAAQARDDAFGRTLNRLAAAWLDDSRSR